MNFTLSLLTLPAIAQIKNIESGEMLSYRIHYGIINAGEASLSVAKIDYRGEPHLYVKGIGKSSGAVRFFFKVDDVYESYINLLTSLPIFYVRNISEGGYKQHLEVTFDQHSETLNLIDKTDENTKDPVKKEMPKNMQDILSAFYYLRNIDPSHLEVGKIIEINIWIDDNFFPFQLKINGKENIKTKFGRINCLKIGASVISGRVFKDGEDVTMWVTDDENHVPVRIQAQLILGSLKADLDDYKGIKYPINFTE